MLATTAELGASATTPVAIAIAPNAKGNTAHITIANVYQSNGVILVVDKVLMQ